MPAFAANLSMLFTELDFPARFAAAADAGFGAVECQFPYAFERELLAERRRASGLPLVLHNLPAGDWAAGDRGIAALPERVAEFRDGVGLALEYAAALGCRQLNCLAGVAPTQSDDAQLRRTLVDNLRFAADALAGQGVELLIEPINSFDVPGFYLPDCERALQIIDAVERDNLRLQFDVYHAQRMRGELAGSLQRLLPRIGHVQIADNPGRHEPGSGEINFPFLFAHLDRIGYRGWVGCEYLPAGATRAGLGWLREWL